MTAKDRSSDTLSIFYFGSIMLAWMLLIALFDHGIRWCIHGAFSVGYSTTGGVLLLVLAGVSLLLELYAILFSLIVLTSAFLVNLSRPAQRRYSAFVDRTVGKFPPFRPAAWLIRPSDTE